MSNLDQMMMNMMMQNPQVAQIMKEVKESGKTPQELFYERAKQKGVNLEDILSKLK